MFLPPTQPQYRQTIWRSTVTYQLLRATPHFYTSIRPVSRAGVCMCVCDLPCLSGCPAAQDWAASHCLFASAATAADYCLLTLTHCGACRKVVPSNMSCILTTTAASLFSSQTPCRFHLPLPRCRSCSLPRKYSYLQIFPPHFPGRFFGGHVGHQPHLRGVDRVVVRCAAFC